MIEYISCSGTDAGYNCPAFICDSCREQIVGEGWAVWASTTAVDGPRRSSPVFTAHKGDCAKALRRWVEETYPSRDRWGLMDDYLTTLVSQLAHNATHALNDGRKMTPHQHELVLPGDDWRP